MITTSQHKPTLPFRLLNFAADAATQQFGYQYEIPYEKFLRAASEQTGLSDYGDPFIHTGLRKFLHSAEQEGNLSFSGRLGARADTLLTLRSRLRMVDLLKRHPEINAVPIRKPIFIVGFPRTGTSLLHRLFWQDPQFRVPLTWELWTPMPHWERPSVSSRKRVAQIRIWGLVMAAPHFRTIHNIEVNEPEECILAMPYHLDKLVRAALPSYRNWCLEHDFIEEYRFYRQILQALQWQQPDRAWVLKTPFHLWKLGALSAAFPDALIIQTHRDPKKAFSSWCSLVAAVRQAFVRERNPHAIGREWLDLFSQGMEKAAQERANMPSEQLFDMQYREFIIDPIAMMERIYSHFGLILTAETRQRMAAWIANNQQHKLGKHTYSLEDYGLDAATVDRELGDYIRHFNIPSES